MPEIPCPVFHPKDERHPSAGILILTMVKASRTCLVLLFLLLPRVKSVLLEDDTPYDTDTITAGSTFCIDGAFDEYVCQYDPRKVRMKVDGARKAGDMHMGVPQRIDGNEEEKKGIKEVLRLMNKYWYEEVLSISAYTKGVRNAW